MGSNPNQNSRDRETARGADDSSGSKRLRLACDSCHKSKIRCAGGNPCSKCLNSNTECRYSYTAKLGKPKGSRSKKTLEKLAAVNGPQDPSRSTSMQSPEPLDHSHPSVNETSTATTSLTSLPLTNDLDAFMQPGGVEDFFDMSGAFNLSSPYSGFISGLISTPADGDRLNIEHDMGGEQEDSEMVDAEAPHFRAGTSTASSVRNGRLPTPNSEKQDSTNSTSSASIPTQSLSTVKKSTDSACTCLERLSNQLCSLQKVERDHELITLDITMAKASQSVGCSRDALSCASCRLDSKVLLLIMTVLQTVFNWAKVEHIQNRHLHRLPTIYVGTWKISEDDGHHIKTLLTNRILASGSAIMNIVRLCLDEISLMASNKEMKFHALDATNLCPNLQRLRTSLDELIQFSRDYGHIEPAPSANPSLEE